MDDRAPEDTARRVVPPAVRRAVARFDAWGDDLADRNHGPVADRVFYGASELADFSLLWHLVGVGRGLTRERGFEEAVRFSALLGVESLLVNGGIKSLFRRTRPPWEIERPRRLRRPRSSSFPSGHASAAFFAATLLAEDSRAWPLWYAAAAVVAASRVYVKIHHPSDVVAGAVTGVVLGRLARRAVPRPR